MAEKMTLEQRVKHFLNLAEDKGATQEERDLASAQAERLMVKHAIDMAMLDGLDTSKPAEQIVTERLWLGGTYAYETMHSLGAVANALGNRHFYYDARRYGRYNPTSGKVEKGVELVIIGFQSDIDVAKVLLRSIEAQGAVAVNAWAKTAFTSWDSASTKYKARREFIEAFGAGAARRIRDSRKVAEEATTGSALVLVDRSKKVGEYIAENYNTRTVKDRRVDSGNGRAAGYAAGQKANVGGSQGSLGR